MVCFSHSSFLNHFCHQDKYITALLYVVILTSHEVWVSPFSLPAGLDSVTLVTKLNVQYETWKKSWKIGHSLVKNVSTLAGLFGDYQHFYITWSTLHFQHWACNWGVIIKIIGKEQSYVTKFCHRKMVLLYSPSEVTNSHQKAEGLFQVLLMFEWFCKLDFWEKKKKQVYGGANEAYS